MRWGLGWPSVATTRPDFDRYLAHGYPTGATRVIYDEFEAGTRNLALAGGEPC